MDDPWGNHAWSTDDSVKVEHSSSEPLNPPTWKAFERDTDENTIDVGIPTWSAASSSSWGEGSNLWHTESSSLDVWKPSLTSDEMSEELDLQPEDAKEQEEDNKSPENKAVLPTPPLSPLPLSSATPPLADTPLESSINPPSPDHFGSFESAEVISEESQDNYSWTPKAPRLPSEDTDEPWGAAWGETVEEGENDTKSDEWESAQETRRKRDKKVPPELLDSLVRLWDEFATSLGPKLSTEDGEQPSWRKGLDSIDGLAELVDSLLPVTSFPPPPPFNKTAVAKSVKETLRLTRSFPLTQSSPMAHLHASKGSTDWEKSVKAQKSAANDEWGWDLKFEPDEKQTATDSIRDKKSGGLLSFWGRKASSAPGAPIGDPTANSSISPTITSKPTSPTSARPSSDSSRVVSPTTATPSPSIPSDDVDTAQAEASSSQASAVSRFFNRFSRKPSAVATASYGQEKRTSLSLSSDDLSFLSDLTPSTTEGSLQSPESASINSIGAMLSGLTKTSTLSSNKLSPSHGPPLLRSSDPAGHHSTNSLGSDTSFDEKMVDAQFMDLLNDSVGGPSSRSGYAPVIVDLLESPVKTKSFSPAPQFTDPPIQPGPTPLTSWISPNSTQNSRNAPTAASAIPPIPPPHDADGSRNRQPIALARFHDPLPPTPTHGLGDLADLFSSSPQSGRNPSPHPGLLLRNDALPSTKPSITTSPPASTSNHANSGPASKTGDSIDFCDFGDFISTPIRRPSPPGDQVERSRAAMHEPTLELVNKGAARQGRWPAPPSPIPLPIPPPLAPPPGPSSNLGYFNYSPSRQPSPFDLLTSDEPHVKATSVSRTSVPDQAAAIPQQSTAFGITPAPLPAVSTFRTSSPLLASTLASSKPAGTSGLSAQDLSFFEGL